MAASPEGNLKELRRLFSPSVNRALILLGLGSEITPGELLRELGNVHPQYGRDLLGKADIDVSAGPRLPAAELLQRVLALHDVDAMRQADDVVHTRSVVLDLAELFPEMRDQLGEDALAAVRDEIGAKAIREYRREARNAAEPPLAPGQQLSPSMRLLVADAGARATAAGASTVEAEHLAGSLADSHEGDNELTTLLTFFGVAPSTIPALATTVTATTSASKDASEVPLGGSARAVFWVAGRLAAALSIDAKTGVSYLRLRDLLGGLLYANTPVRDGLLAALDQAGVPTRQMLDAYPAFLAEPYKYELREFLTEERHLASPGLPLNMPPNLVAIVRGAGEPFAGFVHDDTRDPDRNLLAGDQLNIEPHVRAFALLMASKELRPPLATGLFGDWGSGKTYFMRALRQEIDRITREARDSELPQRELPVYRNVVQIEFNAWHYVDSDLWASLADYIFANLRIEERESLPDVERRRRLYVEQLKQKGAALRQVETERLRLEEQIEQSETRLDRIRREKSERVGLLDVARASIKVDPQTQKAVNALVGKLGVPQATQAADDVEASLRAARTTVVQGNAVLKTLEGRYGWGWLLVALAAVLLGPFVLLLSGAFDWSGVNRVASTLAAFLAGAAGLLRTGTDATKRVLSKIDALDAQVQESIDSNPEVVAHRQRIEKLNKERRNVLDTESRLKDELKDIEQALQHLTPGRLLADFILSRQDSDDYRKHLGLASLIRRDFDELTLHIREFNKSLEVLPPEPDDAGPRVAHGDDKAELAEEHYHLNRIILYIDDLDRCPPDKVVQVLQAVHLLLYFPLFVVVVGVDARWLARSLEKHYRGLLSGAPDGSDPATNFARSATPHDYLEKIFQIPFWLRPMPRTAQTRLLTSLTGQAFVAGRQEPAPDTDDQLSAARPAIAIAGSNVAANGKGASESPTGPERGDIDQDAESAAPPYDLRIDQIRVTEEERTFMEDIRPLLGRSPRSLTRFVNVYRLTKAVARNEGVGGGHIGELDEQEVAMFLLAMVTGLPTISSRLFSELARSAADGDATLGDVVQGIEPQNPTVQVQSKQQGRQTGDSRARSEWLGLESWLEERPTWRTAKLTPRDDESARSWIDWARRVARYSYRLEQT